MSTTPPTSLTRYFISHNEASDINLDLLAWAETPEDALRHWRGYYETEKTATCSLSRPRTRRRVRCPGISAAALNGCGRPRNEQARTEAHERLAEGGRHGDFAHFRRDSNWRANLDSCGDSLFRFLMIKLSTQEDCESRRGHQPPRECASDIAAAIRNIAAATGGTKTSTLNWPQSQRKQTP